MRFGRHLHRHRIPEWNSFYLSYHQLKRAIKSATKASTNDNNGDHDLTSEFFGLYFVRAPESRLTPSALLNILQSAVEDVESFYQAKYAIIENRIASLDSAWGSASALLQLSSHTRENATIPSRLLADYLEARCDLKKLLWYGKVNKDGFSCLLRKLQRIPASQVSFNLEFSQYKFVMQDGSRTLSLPDFVDGSTIPDKVRLALEQAIAADNFVELSEILQDQYLTMVESITAPQSPQHTLIDFAIQHGSKQCILTLLNRTELPQNGDIQPHTNFLHHLIIDIGHNSILRDDINRQVKDRTSVLHTTQSQESRGRSSLMFLLDSFDPAHAQALLQKDSIGRSPLHYAAFYGLEEVCKKLIDLMRNWGLVSVDGNIQGYNPYDVEGHTPLYLAVVNGHTGVISILLDLEASSSERLGTQTLDSLLGELVCIAVSAGFEDVCRVLLDHPMMPLGYQLPSGETALFLPAQSGNVNIVTLLLANESRRDSDIDLPEAYGWTPLIVACIQEHLSVVRILIEAGANEWLFDLFGWTARDHVAFRGFWPIANVLTHSTPGSSIRIRKPPLLSTNAMLPCATDECRIFLNLGTLNTRKPRDILDMKPYLARYPHSPYPETGFSIEVDAIGATGAAHMVQLPQLYDANNHPIHKECPQTEGRLKHIGTAVALLDSLKGGLDATRESLVRSYTVPIIEKDSMDFIGTVVFDFLLVKPFPSTSLSVPMSQDILKGGGITKVVGHRGLGQNNPEFRRLQIGENTIQVDNAYFKHSTDVQLTRDHIPVIYHDFLVSESGADLAPHNLSLDQFMYISELQKPREDVLAVLEDTLLTKCSTSSPWKGNKLRSRSLDLILGDGRTQDFINRMHHTYEFRKKGFKGNLRGHQIHSSFTTLEELLRSIPETVSIDIELKYPMLWEAEDWKMDLYGVELNIVVDTVLEKVSALAGNRAIVFTSFSPELCILASHKQQKYPVMFLNE
ncbi:hypothetical protein DL98DRAFT_595678 [Cadophora sp. DSE1049]|nr:hypothetical protein DL98DRAFT_595678 [Cadophora sp. DSE1049]